MLTEVGRSPSCLTGRPRPVSVCGVCLNCHHQPSMTGSKTPVCIDCRLIPYVVIRILRAHTPSHHALRVPFTLARDVQNGFHRFLGLHRHQHGFLAASPTVTCNHCLHKRATLRSSPWSPENTRQSTLGSARLVRRTTRPESNRLPRERVTLERGSWANSNRTLRSSYQNSNIWPAGLWQAPDLKSLSSRSGSGRAFCWRMPDTSGRCRR